MQTKDDDKLDEVKAILRRLQRIGTDHEEGAAPAAPERTPHSREGSRRERTRHKIAVPPNGVKTAAPGPQDASVAEVKAEPQSGSRRWKVAFAIPTLLLVGGLGFTFWLKTGEKAELRPLPGRTTELNTAQQSEAERQRTIAAIPQPDQPQSGAESAINLQTRSVSPTAPPPPSDQEIERLSHALRLIDEGKVVAGRDLLLGGLAERMADAALALARSYDPNSLRQIANADAPPEIEQAERWYRRWHEIAASDGLALDAQRLDRIIKAMK